MCFTSNFPNIRKKDEEGTGEDERVPFVLCHYTVFNVEQCDGLTLPEIEQPTTAPEIDEDEFCESIVTGWRTAPRSISTAPPSTALTIGQALIPSTCQRGAANPAVTIARALSNTFAGIRPIDVPLFVAAQFVGGIAATLLFRWLIPSLPSTAKEVIVRHQNDH